MTAPPESEGERSARPLVDAITTILRSGLPGEPRPTRSAVDLVLGVLPSDEANLAPRIRAGYVSALICSELQNGQAGHAAALADREGLDLLRRVAGQASPAMQSAGYSVMSKAYLLTGRCLEGAHCARVAIEYAEEAQDEAGRFRAQGLLAANLGVNGEFAAAEIEMKGVSALASAHGWSLDEWPLALAGVLVNGRSRNGIEIEAALESIGVADPFDDIVRRNVVRVCRIWLHATRGEHRDMVAAAREIRHSVDRQRCPPFLVDLALSLECLALIHLGEVGTALSLIAGHQSSPGHTVCFELHRATIHLRMGEPRQALRATHACVHDCPDHNLRTLPSILLRRAVAYEHLGRPGAADAEFSRSAHLSAEFGALSPTLGMSRETLTRLFTRLREKEPEFGRLMGERLVAAGDDCAPGPLSLVPVHLTERESVLATWLPTSLTFGEIAENLHVSVNTVKTQVRTLYRKLGVTSREDAVSALDRVGRYTTTLH